ncbi:MAG: P-II family nitrogen regulator [Proteobacteria bacterium]|nr:P-II family nitrogen regulator [Pseudomonadota bacterium]
MKLVIGIIQPDMLNQVREELIKSEITRITVSRCTGRGRASDIYLYRGQEVAPALLPKVRLDIACNDEFVDIAVDAIIRGAKHGNGKTGDGKIFVVPLEKVYRIHTDEQDGSAI